MSVEINGALCLVRVRPARELAPGFFVVVFEVLVNPRQREAWQKILRRRSIG